MDKPVAMEKLAAESARVHPRRRWAVVQQHVNDIWRRGKKEVVSLLNIWKRWHAQKQNLAVGDVVLCVMPDAPRGQWPLGRIVGTFPGDDKEVRVVDVKFGGKVKRRSIQQLILLPVQRSDD